MPSAQREVRAAAAAAVGLLGYSRGWASRLQQHHHSARVCVCAQCVCVYVCDCVCVCGCAELWARKSLVCVGVSLVWNLKVQRCVSRRKAQRWWLLGFLWERVISMPARVLSAHCTTRIKLLTGAVAWGGGGKCALVIDGVILFSILFVMQFTNFPSHYSLITLWCMQLLYLQCS